MFKNIFMKEESSNIRQFKEAFTFSSFTNNTNLNDVTSTNIHCISY